MSDIFLSAESISKSIKKKKIIKNISFEVRSGEVFGFLGPNGAGKTTTIRMILGLISIDSGDVKICGMSIKSKFEAAISNVGGIVENPEVYSYMSGYDNLVHYARMHEGITRERITKVIELNGLENRIKDKVKTYSLGMRQRLGVAQALLHKPKLLVLDEPTNGLDPSGIHEFRTLMKTLAHEEKMAVFVSSHLLSEMEMMCDRFAVIQGGEIISVENINAEKFDAGLQNIMIEAQPVDKCFEIIRGIYGSAEQKSNTVTVKMPKEQIPEVVEKLSSDGVKIYQIIIETKSLEERFLELTGGSKIE